MQPSVQVASHPFPIAGIYRHGLPLKSSAWAQLNWPELSWQTRGEWFPKRSQSWGSTQGWDLFGTEQAHAGVRARKNFNCKRGILTVTGTKTLSLFLSSRWNYLHRCEMETVYPRILRCNKIWVAGLNSSLSTERSAFHWGSKITTMSISKSIFFNINSLLPSSCFILKAKLADRGVKKMFI